MGVNYDFCSDAIEDVTADTDSLGADVTFLSLITGLTNRGGLTRLSDLTFAPGDLGVLKQVTPWSELYVSGTSTFRKQGPILTWQPGSSGDFCTVVGWAWLFHSPADFSNGFELFAEPVIVANLSQIIHVLPRITVSPGRIDFDSVAWS